MSIISLAAATAPSSGRFTIQLVKPGFTRMIAIEIRDDIEVPLIDLSLTMFCHPQGLIWAGEEYERQPRLIAAVMWRGRRIEISGAAVALSDGLDMLLPRGALT